MKKLVIILSALMLLLCACSVPAGSNKIDYGSFEDYYGNLAYEVKNDGGSITEQLYVLWTDEEMVNAVGTKDVFFDPDSGDMTRYTVTIGGSEIERLVTYTSGEGASYYSEMYFDSGILTRTVWENEYPDESRNRVQSKGYEEYFSDGKTVKSFREELYKDGELESATTREYAEDGTVTSEKVE